MQCDRLTSFLYLAQFFEPATIGQVEFVRVVARDQIADSEKPQTVEVIRIWLQRYCDLPVHPIGYSPGVPIPSWAGHKHPARLEVLANG